MAAAGPATEPAKVLYVVDGDTIKVELAGRKESIRLIGIDTPESKANAKAKKDAGRSRQDIKTIVSLGKAATKFTKSIVKPGDIVYIEQDVEPRDRYGRILAYVYLRSGEMLNEKIIAAGYASVMTIPPNIRYQERFVRGYKVAREGSLGLWAASP
ncbi:MAG: thermonuclease family protein [Elusimicrobia bacterium]|nr:thermonuclease family protein [Elusimicrobiota bacterium]